jgi:Na+-transporting NADH:ubiquinone oxidoreductase subunit NqrD
VAAFWLFVGVAEALAREPEPFTAESFIMASLMTISVVGVVVGWFREGLGAAVLLLVATGHSFFAYFAAGHNKGFAMAISGGPFFIIGGLFLACWLRSREARLA